MKTYVIIAVVGLLVFVGGFYFLYNSFKQDQVKTLSDEEILLQLDDSKRDEFRIRNNAEFEEQAIPLNDEAMSQL